MRLRLQNKLKTDCPLLYTRLFNEPSKIPHPVELVGIECQDGWFDLIYNLSCKLEALIEKEPKELQNKFAVSQIKQKLGSLCFYLDSWTDEMGYYIKEAEFKSSSLCEKCGKKGERKEFNKWYLTLCNDCDN